MASESLTGNELFVQGDYGAAARAYTAAIAESETARERAMLLANRAVAYYGEPP